MDFCLKDDNTKSEPKTFNYYKEFKVEEKTPEKRYMDILKDVEKHIKKHESIKETTKSAEAIYPKPATNPTPKQTGGNKWASLKDGAETKISRSVEPPKASNSVDPPAKKGWGDLKSSEAPPKNEALVDFSSYVSQQNSTARSTGSKRDFSGMNNASTLVKKEEPQKQMAMAGGGDGATATVGDSFTQRIQQKNAKISAALSGNGGISDENNNSVNNRWWAMKK